jgi:uncharacterized protein YndB with AHSA1/START domain
LRTVLPRGATRVVSHELRIDASPETVFSFFTDPARIVAWMGEEATLDPRPGGICRVVFGPGVMCGSFTEVVPHSRLVFTWGWEQRYFDVPPGETRVEVTLTPDGGGTLVRLTHTGLPPTAIGFHTVGWEHYLERLELAARGAHAGPDPLLAPTRADVGAT